MKKIFIISFLFVAATGFAQSAAGVAKSGSTSGVEVVPSQNNNSQKTQKKEVPPPASKQNVNKSETERTDPTVQKQSSPSSERAIKQEGIISTEPIPSPTLISPIKQEN